jgi:hypothetical protein
MGVKDWSRACARECEVVCKELKRLGVLRSKWLANFYDVRWIVIQVEIRWLRASMKSTASLR